ncbi:hypothetical protein [Mesorhizobium sp.]|uniref:hypothetical protein n=1 Tax=Mesorhizobium sp. TaxID=1871066 RepID=UPI000FE7C994|nr:hypothetical protein [Mesorhizobium sp.]RWD85113.1 MAG: hypothetical protein EOS48_03125 [Mesorhizobium sp.]TIS36380.1 MAG: hypothetical protein E5W95_23415 [Mesorhizobium sp.]TIX86200.1 MAG: hypothetical protein E5V21_01760 [Mesorhizobium sp.]
MTTEDEPGLTWTTAATVKYVRVKFLDTEQRIIEGTASTPVTDWQGDIGPPQHSSAKSWWSSRPYRVKQAFANSDAGATRTRQRFQKKAPRSASVFRALRGGIVDCAQKPQWERCLPVLCPEKPLRMLRSMAERQL